MKTVSLPGSPRKQGNSSAVAKHFCNAAEDIGAAVRAFSLNELHYRGCQA
ncbi:MAG TPA: flavodoxin family protein [Deltaproteobacteria bacterium]|nr:flavodoxin family protein [Deltaproteobacteria bacterium]